MCPIHFLHHKLIFPLNLAFVYIQVLQACSLLPCCLCWHIAAFLFGALAPPVDPWDSVKPFAGVCIISTTSLLVYMCMKQTTQGPSASAKKAAP